MGGKQSSNGSMSRARSFSSAKTLYKGALVQTLSGHKDIVMCCTFSPDGKYLATSSADHSVVIWEVATFRKKHRLDNEHSHTAEVTSASFSPDSSLLISGINYLEVVICPYINFLPGIWPSPSM